MHISEVKDKKSYNSWKLDEVFSILDMMRNKQLDYASYKDPLSNFTRSANFGVDPLIGLSLRMSDKMARLESYCKNGKLAVENEGLEDIFKDLIGYSVIALAMLHQDEWE